MKNAPLPLDDARAVFRLLGEVREVGLEPSTWRRHMLEALRDLTGAAVGVAGEVSDAGSAEQQTLQTVDIGWSDAASRGIWLRYQRKGKWEDPLYRRVTRGPYTIRTCRSEEVIARREWYGSRYFREYQQPAGVDSRLTSLCRIPAAGVTNVITLHRALHDPPFSPRHGLMLHLLHEELARLWEIELAQRQRLTARLSRRQQQTLDGLRAGKSEKQVAYALGLSRHTIHNNVKQLHRRFRASNRAELLLTSASPSQQMFRAPRLCVSAG